MKTGLLQLSRRYQAALQAHLRPGRSPDLAPARGLGAEALAAGLQTLDLAKLHEQTLLNEVLPGCASRRRAGVIRRAGRFFAVAITPNEQCHRSALAANLDQERFIATLSERTVELAASNRELGREIAQRKTAEAALRQSEQHYAQLLEKSGLFQEQLRRLSRQILSAQEEERKKISRELHDVIAQTLTGINIRLATLKRDAALNTRGLDRNITLTQRLVEKSVNIVHRFARELRPAVLDDLGLVAALQTYLEAFSTRTGIRTRLVSPTGLPALDSARRTVLFRVAQEALTNVARHAEASRVVVSFRQPPGGVVMIVEDNGRSFSVEQAFRAGRGRRLGLLGMRERLEMVGGSLTVGTKPGRGTRIEARLPPTTAAHSRT